MRSPITTHVLDTSTGRPAAGVPIRLERLVGGSWEVLSDGVTNEDGRVSDLVSHEIEQGIYRLTFDLAAYFGEQEHFYPVVRIEFRVGQDGRHYHVPLLLSPFGYSTYRGS
ncbi:MAG TPA: hydroxyisourate hydrolase [Rhodothermales bacterium]|nr:hydroxyisourate hydrolase [Rhodothermales bacterium]